jgi:hypothetical protein
LPDTPHESSCCCAGAGLLRSHSAAGIWLRGAASTACAAAAAC